jgi:hypothetical protein
MGTGEKTKRESRTRADMDAKPQTEQKHPEPWSEDLNPNRMAGQNIGIRSAEREHGLRTAFDLKEAHRALADQFTDDELKQIPLIPDGQPLQQGAVYIDLRDGRRKEFTAIGDMSATSSNWYIPKSEVHYSLWNRLIGVTNPARIPEKKRTG